MIELKARCTGNAQDTNGRHTATLLADNGLTSFSLPSDDLKFVPGNTYKVTIDGEFAKPVPIQPVKPPVPAPKPVVAPNQAVPKVQVSQPKP